MSDEDDINFGKTDEGKYRDPKPRGGRTGNGRSGRSGNGGHPNSAKNLKPWRAGESGNPGGMSKGCAEIMKLARDEGPASIAKLAEIRDNPKTPPMAAVQASVALLDRGCGKPAAAIYHAGSVSGLEIEADEAEGLTALLMRAKLAKGIQ